jgi:hypothetical protein
LNVINHVTAMTADPQQDVDFLQDLLARSADSTRLSSPRASARIGATANRQPSPCTSSERARMWSLSERCIHAATTSAAAARRAPSIVQR